MNLPADPPRQYAVSRPPFGGLGRRPSATRPKTIVIGRAATRPRARLGRLYLHPAQARRGPHPRAYPRLLVSPISKQRSPQLTRRRPGSTTPARTEWTPLRPTGTEPRLESEVACSCSKATQPEPAENDPFRPALGFMVRRAPSFLVLISAALLMSGCIPTVGLERSPSPSPSITEAGVDDSPFVALKIVDPDYEVTGEVARALAGRRKQCISPQHVAGRSRSRGPLHAPV